MPDIAEQICLAIDQIVSERLKSINYDTTIVATIADDTNASDYKYICSNGSAQFVAFSKDTTYKKGDSVQVTIPNNDYDQQKIIIGKYVVEDSTPYVFTLPFETFIDVSANLIGVSKSEGLLANKDFDSKLDNSGQIVNQIFETVMWSNYFEEGYKGFDRLGLKGQFRSWINSLKAVEGDYGYRLEVFSTNGDLLKESQELKVFDSVLTLYNDLLNDQDITYYETVLRQVSENLYKEFFEKYPPKEESLDANKTNQENFIAIFSDSKIDKKEQKTMLWGLLNLKLKITNLYLSSEEMYGNPYNFQNYFEQEKVFDISSLGNIIAMTLYFYEESGTFKDELGNYIPYYFGSKETPRPNNLFSKDAYVCLGYDLANFDKEQAILYSMDSDSFLIKDNINPEENWKTIRLRWLHEFESGNIGLVSEATADVRPYDAESNPEGYEIRWYQFNMGSPSADEYSGVYWQRIPNQNEVTDENGNIGLEVSYVGSDSNFNCYLRPRTNKASEQVKAVIIYNDNIITSNILTFTNQDEEGVSNAATAKTLAGLSLWCEDDSYGNYFIYGQNNKILETEELSKNTILTLQAKFADASLLESEYDIDKVAPNLTEARKIIWEFPLNNTMLVVNGFNYNYLNNPITDPNDNTIITGYQYKLDGYFEDAEVEIVSILGLPVIRITRLGERPEDGSSNDYTIVSHQDYRIKDFYSNSNINNTVKCTVIKNNMTYSASKEFSFGLRGTSGTDATLVIDFDNNVSALTANKEESVKVTAHLYDSAYKEVDFYDASLKLTAEWEWAYYYEKTDSIAGKIKDKIKGLENEASYYEDDGITLTNKAFISYSEEYGSIAIKGNKEDSTLLVNQWSLEHNTNLIDSFNTKSIFAILKVTVKGFGDYDLAAYKAIPIRANENYSFMVGPTEIIYNTTGTVSYYKEPVLLYGKTENGINVLTKINWDTYNPYLLSDEDIGEVSNLNILKPLAMYVKDVYPYGIAAYSTDDITKATPYWLQPLVIIQNEYFSSTINQWDGKSVSTGDGYLLSPAIAAGKKDSLNRFSGVMLGDWSNHNTADDISKQTGVYGFHEGALSFAFKENGTALLGKSGKGRILFDGNSGVIKSQNWDISSSGMFMDLDQGILKLQKNSQYEQVVVTKDSWTPETYYVFKSYYSPIPLRAVDATGNGDDDNSKPEAIWSNQAYFLYQLKDLGLLSRLDFLTKQENSINAEPDSLNDKSFYYKDIIYEVISTYDENETSYFVDDYLKVNVDEETYNNFWDNTKSSRYYVKKQTYELAKGDFDNTKPYYLKFQQASVSEEAYNNALNKENESTIYYIQNEDGSYKKASGAYNKETVYFIENYYEISITEEAYKNSLKEDGTSTKYYRLIGTTFELSTNQFVAGTSYYRKDVKINKICNNQEEFDKLKTEGYTTIYKMKSYSYKLVDKNTQYDEIQIYAGYIFVQQIYTVEGPADKKWNTELDINLKDEYKYKSTIGCYYIYIEGYFEDDASEWREGIDYYELVKAGQSKYITISAEAETFPLSIGITESIESRRFRVEWDGTVWIKDGNISGIINADELYCNYGYIGGWQIDNTSLSGGQTVLDSASGIFTNRLSIIDSISDTSDTGVLGQMGLILGSTGEGNTTYNIGITSLNQSIVLDTMQAQGSTSNIALRSKTGAWAQCQNFYIMGNTGWQSKASSTKIFANEVYIDSTSVKFTADAKNQEGIYARFA